MKKKTTITLVLLAGLGLASVGASAAMASTPSTPPTIPSTSTSTEAPESSSTETAGVSDGPGGHADAPGVDVNNEGGASEQ